MKMLAFCLLWISSSFVLATPTVNLPINAQVPPVAQVDTFFSFTFSDSTVASTSGTTTYSLHNAPSWLSVDSPNRVISGTPRQKDIGAIVLDLVAEDTVGALMMEVTLVVSSDAGPTVGLSVADQLPAYGSYLSPNTLLLPQSSPISLSFSSNTFSNTGSQTVYYALCANRTPLPSWIHFDPSTLTFTGTTPNLVSPADTSSSTSIVITASNVVGFAQASASFQISVETHFLAFKTSLQIINATAGSPISPSVLGGNLLLDGKTIDSSQISSISAPLPGWLNLDRSSLALTGTPPSQAVGQNLTITVTDTFNDSASIMVIIQTDNTSDLKLLNPIGAVNATIGSKFTYLLDNSINDADASVTVDLGTASSWLLYDRNAKNLHGTVPSNLKPQQVVVNITATQGSQSQSELLTVAVQEAGQGGDQSQTTSGNSDTSSTESSSSSQSAQNAPGHRSRRWIAAAVLLPISALLGIALLLFFCCYRRRKYQKGRKRAASVVSEISSASSKKDISRPMVDEKMSQTDVNGNAMSGGLLDRKAASRVSLPPRLPWTWLSSATKPDSRPQASRNSLTERSPRPDSWSKFTAGFLGITTPKLVQNANFHDIPEEGTPYKLEQNEPNSMPYRNAEPSMTRSGFGSTSLRLTSKGPRSSTSNTLGRAASLRSQLMGAVGHSNQRTFGRGHGSVLLGSIDEPRGFGSRGRPPGFGVVQKSWRNMHNSQSTDEWTDISAESSNPDHTVAHSNFPFGYNPESIRQPTIRPVWPSQTISKHESTTSSVRPPSLVVPKCARVRHSDNPFLSRGSIYPRAFSQGSSTYKTAPWRRKKRLSAHRRSSDGALTFDLAASSNRSTISPERSLSGYDYTLAPKVLEDEEVHFPEPHSRDRRYESAVPSETHSLCESSVDGDVFQALDDPEGFWQQSDQHDTGLTMTSPEDGEHVTMKPHGIVVPSTAAAAALLLHTQRQHDLEQLVASSPRLDVEFDHTDNEEDEVEDGGNDADAEGDERDDFDVNKPMSLTTTRRPRGAEKTVGLMIRGPKGRRLGEQLAIQHGGLSCKSVRGDIKDLAGSGSSFL